MDLLSDVIAVMRTGRPRSARVTWHAPWGQAFAPVPGAAGFQVILHGRCWLIAPDAPPVPLAPGDVVFRPHGRGHALVDDPSTPPAQRCGPHDRQGHRADAVVGSPDVDAPATVTVCGAYELDAARIHPLMHALPEVVHLPAHLGRHPELRATVDLLAAESERPAPGTDAVVTALLDTLLVHILRAWLDRQDPLGTDTGWAAALRDPATTAGLQAMHRDPARSWTVATLAVEAGLSRASFARRFSTLVGRSPLAYLTWWRMTTAARLLRESDVPLAVIAAQVGYASEFALANAFKRQYGTAPGRYRRSG